MGTILHRGVCRSACPAGLLPWGTNTTGLECKAAGAQCNGTAASCPCPEQLVGPGCMRCEVGAGAAARCVKCAADRFLVKGRCEAVVHCKSYVIEETGGKCDCRTSTSDPADNCVRCRLTNGWKGARTCLRCRNSLYLARDQPEGVEGGSCVAAEACPKVCCYLLFNSCMLVASPI